VIADLPRHLQEQLIVRLSLRLAQGPLGGALIAALTDVVYDRMPVGVDEAPMAHVTRQARA
jgi:hypothetical protein